MVVKETDDGDIIGSEYETFIGIQVMMLCGLLQLLVTDGVYSM